MRRGMWIHGRCRDNLWRLLPDEIVQAEMQEFQ